MVYKTLQHVSIPDILDLSSFHLSAYTDDVFIMWHKFSHVEWKSDKVMTCWEILGWEFYNVRAFGVFDKFV